MNDKCSLGAQNKEAIKQNTKRLDKIEDKVEKIPTIEHILKEVVNTNKKQNEIMSDVSETLIKVSMQLEHSEKNHISLEGRVKTIEENSTINTNSLVRNAIVWLLSGGGIVYFIGKLPLMLKQAIELFK